MSEANTLEATRVYPREFFIVLVICERSPLKVRSLLWEIVLEACKVSH